MVFDTPRSYLLTERKDLGLSDRDLADVFLSALMSMLKSLSAVRLECMGVMYRFMWHGGSWLDSAVEYPSFFFIDFWKRNEYTELAPIFSNPHVNDTQSSLSLGQSKRRP